jgi:hypothetical protein
MEWIYKVRSHCNLELALEEMKEIALFLQIENQLV